jgi:hypothetical protein
MMWLFEGVLWLVWEFILSFLIYNTGVILLRILSIGYWKFTLIPLGVTDVDFGKGGLLPYLVGLLFYGLIFYWLFK